MFTVLTTGVGLWCVYGFLRMTGVIVIASGVSLLCLAGILYFKLRSSGGNQDTADASGTGGVKESREAGASLARL